MDKQEYFVKLQMLEQQAEHFGEQVKIIDQQIDELYQLKDNIDKISNSKEIEMFSELGKGIYVKGKLDKGEILVDVGNKILLPKTNQDIEMIVTEQIKKFKELKMEIGKQVEKVNSDFDALMNKAHNEPEESSNSNSDEE